MQTGGSKLFAVCIISTMAGVRGKIHFCKICWNRIVQNCPPDTWRGDQLTLSRRRCFPPPDPFPPLCRLAPLHCLVEENSENALFAFRTFLLLWHFWTVEYLHNNEHQSKSVYCSIEAHCCGWGVRPGRLVTNRSSRRRFGLFSTQQSSRAHLAPPPPKTFHTTR